MKHMGPHSHAGTSSHTRRLLWLALIGLALAVLLAAPFGATGPEAARAAQISPLSPLVVEGGASGETMPFQAPSFNPLASGHAGLWRALIILAVVVTAATVMVWRQA